MNALLLNRNFELPSDGWFHLVPKGSFRHPKGLVQVIDGKATEAIVNRFSQDAKSQQFPGLLVDFDHFSDDEDKPSEAAGWVTELQNRENGVWGKVRWSDVGEAAVKGGRYRLVSPVFTESASEPVEDGQLANKGKEGKRIRPLRLIKVALTNDPNLKGMVPLSNREASGDAADSSPNQSQKHMLKDVITLLGLPADTTEQAAVAEVGKLKNRNSVLESENKTLLGAQVEADLEKYKNRIKPEAKDKWKTQLLVNRGSTIELLEGLPEVSQAAGKEEKKETLHNRAGAKTPETPKHEDASADEAKANKIKNRASELRAASPGRGWDACWAQAEEEVSSK